MQAFTALVRNDLRLFFSNRRAVLMAIVAPIAIAIFFGYLFGDTKSAPARIGVGIVDLDGSALSTKIIVALRADPALAVATPGATAAATALRQGELPATVTFPAGFGAAASASLMAGGAKPEVALHYDPSQTMALQVIRGVLAEHVMQVVAQAAFADAGATSGSGSADKAASFEVPYALRQSEATSATRPDARYNSYAHAFAGMGVQFVLLMGIDLGIGLLLTRRMDLWKRLRAAPLSKATLLGSRLASGALTALVVLATLYVVAIAGFGVRIDGSGSGFVAILVAFALFTTSLGLFIAAIGRTPEATRGLAILVTLLMVMLGGAWVPAFVFPQWLQQVSLCVPTRWAVDGLDAMTWRGLGWGSAWAPVAVLLGSAAALAALAVMRFRWEE